jgi:uncharacterized lipoprotein YmbA
VNPEENKVMKRLFLRFAVITMGAVLMFTLGCARTKSAKFYTLNSLDVSHTESRSEETQPGVALGIGPISFPDYLDRPQIITRDSRNALTFAEFHRWAGNLREDFSRILAENLSILLATDRIALFPWQSSTPIDYRVTANVIRFEGKIGGDVTLKVRWSILGGAGKKVLVMKTSNFIAPVKGTNYEALVAVQSRALAEFSREIAETINIIAQ